MQAILAWADAHPALMVNIVWPLVTLILTTVTRKRTDAELQAMNPRLAAVLKLVGALGFDGPKLVRSLQQLFTGVPVFLPGTRKLTPDEVDTSPELDPK